MSNATFVASSGYTAFKFSCSTQVSSLLAVTETHDHLEDVFTHGSLQVRHDRLRNRMATIRGCVRRVAAAHDRLSERASQGKRPYSAPEVPDEMMLLIGCTNYSTTKHWAWSMTYNYKDGNYYLYLFALLHISLYRYNMELPSCISMHNYESHMIYHQALAVVPWFCKELQKMQCVFSRFFSRL